MGIEITNGAASPDSEMPESSPGSSYSSEEEYEAWQNDADAAPLSPFSPQAARRALERRMSSINRTLRRSISLELLPSAVEAVAEPSLPPEALATVPKSSFTEELRRRIADTLLVTKLAARLYSYLRGGTKWLVNFWRLVLFAAILMPAFLQMMVFYFLSPRLLRSIPYGIESRNMLDIYVPRKKWRRRGPRPVVIFLTGGAWTIGYKAWGALLGRRLSQRGVLVFCLDYRNFPQGNLPDMLEDVNRGIGWVLNNAHLYGGDPSTVYITGQSAGAQLGSLAMFAQVEQAVHGGKALGGFPAWDPSKIKGFCGVSGPYNMYALQDHLDRRGLYKNILRTLMSVDGEVMFKDLSPTYAVR